MDLRLTKATDADVPALVALQNDVFSSPWSERLIRDELSHAWSTTLLARAEGAVVGFITWWVVHDEQHILNVGTSPRVQRRGIGATLLDAALDAGRAAGARIVCLEVRRGNDAALALYGSRGFVRVGLRPRYYQDNGEDAVLMQCDAHRAPGAG